MKNKVFSFLCLAILIVNFYSCKKTNTRKVSNNWRVKTMYQETSYTSYYNDENSKYINEFITHTTFQIDAIVFEYAISETNFDFDSQTNDWELISENSDETGIVGGVNEYSYNINKDGTWDMLMNYTLYTIFQNLDIVETRKGTWEFLGKTDDFKNNERIMFNTIEFTESQVLKNIDGDILSENFETKNFSEGEDKRVFVVQKSNRNQLMLYHDSSLDNEVTNSNEPNHNDETFTVNTIKLNLIPAN